MRRARKWGIDGRLKLQIGDVVKVTASGRREIKKHGGPALGPYITGKVKQINFDISENRFFAVVTISAVDYWMPISDLIYQYSTRR